ncbi:PREDICTED: nucleolar complex protein 4 homolog B [Nicrophorus vespilloides]|uniref:Nucleolar complex protein 4 homolog B n=1 Tax=Nicrophorus vespilloides TaxID=110193 RepID=A0ABM1NDP8_NICVS|nr:PREDICTED: nucleolar complex protein 4 homolog B [Nicrophorus vespilloides]
MSQQEKPMKISKVLRQKAQEMLGSRKYANNLLDIMRHFDTGADTCPCILTLEMIFTSLLKSSEMFIEIVPLKPMERTAEIQYREWLKQIYEEAWNKMVHCLDHASPKVATQALASCMNIMAHEGRYPLEPRSSQEHYIPFYRLKPIVMKIIFNRQSSAHLINKFQEYLVYDDMLFATWKLLPSLTAKTNPNDVYIMNFLMLLEKLQLQQNTEGSILFSTEEGEHNFIYDENSARKSLNKVWNCVMLWEQGPVTLKQLLIVLLERVMPYLDKPLMLTDFLMDALDIGGPVSLLALQGLFTLIQSHNLDYPNIFAKLYSMFEPEIFHTKFKARLFYLSDMFLSSTHLPENMVAAFAKRLARLALIAPSEDIIIICMFIGNLILRHPGLKCMLNHPNGGSATNDPYIMEERDPVKSNAINSSLWEIQSLQNHVLPSVAMAARFINTPLPSVEWDITKVLDNSSDDIFDKEIKKNHKLIALAFDRPNGCFLNRGEIISQYWNF